MPNPLEVYTQVLRISAFGWLKVETVSTFNWLKAEAVSTVKADHVFVTSFVWQYGIIGRNWIHADFHFNGATLIGWLLYITELNS
jgi:hypothetical protein